MLQCSADDVVISESVLKEALTVMHLVAASGDRRWPSSVSSSQDDTDEGNLVPLHTAALNIMQKVNTLVFGIKGPKFNPVVSEVLSIKLRNSSYFKSAPVHLQGRAQIT